MTDDELRDYLLSFDNLTDWRAEQTVTRAELINAAFAELARQSGVSVARAARGLVAFRAQLEANRQRRDAGG